MGFTALSRVTVISSKERHPSVGDLQTSTEEMFNTVDDEFCHDLQFILVPLIFQHSIVDENVIISSGIVMLNHPFAGILCPHVKFI